MGREVRAHAGVGKILGEELGPLGELLDAEAIRVNLRLMVQIRSISFGLVGDRPVNRVELSLRSGIEVLRVDVS
jgi:hypothetical protein